MKSVQQQLQEAYLGMKGALSEKDEQVVSDILALDELSKKTLGSYIKKSSENGADNAMGFSSHFDKKETGKASKALHKMGKRLDGIKKATDRLTKEEFEETLDEMIEMLDEEALTELSKKTLGSYIKKSSENGADNAMGFSSHFDKKETGKASKALHKMGKRLDGIVRATNRLTKEQKELIGSILEELQAEED